MQAKTIAFNLPNPESIYAIRTIYNGYKNAALDMGHKFVTFTAEDNLQDFLAKHQPDIFITSAHFYYQKYLDHNLLKQYRDRGMKVFANTPFWNSPIENRINEGKSLKDYPRLVRLIKRGLLADFFYNVCEQGDPRMDGFEQETGYTYHTIPLACDKILMKESFEAKFVADISFIGTYLPQKRKTFKNWVFPLKKKYNLKLYGQDWTWIDRQISFIAKIGQYFNIPIIKALQKPKLQLEDESKIYSSSKICINIHEEYQKQFGGDCNERTFKIPACGAFEITDEVACIKKYFVEGQEIVIAKNRDDWFDKIEYYINRPEERKKIAKQGQKKVLKEHTYHNRLEYMLNLIK